MYVLMRRVSQRGGRCQWVRYALCSSAGTLERVIRGQPDPTNWRVDVSPETIQTACLVWSGMASAMRHGAAGVDQKGDLFEFLRDCGRETLF